MRPPPDGPGRLFNRDFFLLWQGQLVSQLGDQAFLVAMMFWMKQATGSATLMGLVMMMSRLPVALLGPVAGTFGDRHSRKAIIVASDLARGIALLAFAYLMVARPDDTETTVAALFVVALFSGVVGALFSPAVAAAIPDLVAPDRVAAANAVNRLSAQAATFIGQTAGGILFRVAGAPILFAFDGLSYALSSLSEVFIRLPAVARPTETPIGRTAGGALRSYATDTREGLRVVWRWTGMRNFILATTAINFLFMPVYVLLPFFTTDVLQRGPEWYGFLLAAFSAGSVVGLSLAAGWRLEGDARGRMMLAALLATAASMFGLGLARGAWLALPSMAAIGALTALINVHVLSLVQVLTPGRLRGRVMGTILALSGAATPLGMAAGGILGDLAGQQIPAIYSGVGVGAALVAVVAASSGAVRRFLAGESPFPSQATGHWPR